MSEPFKGFTFCEVVDGLLYERTRLTAMKVVTDYYDTVSWHRFLVNRALKENLKRIKRHECALCQRNFRALHREVAAAGYRLMEEELTSLRLSVQTYLKREIEEERLLD